MKHPQLSGNMPKSSVNTSIKVYIKTMGCKVNTYDGDAISTRLTREGYQMVDDPSMADIAILNTCSVTKSSDRESRHLLRRYRRANPNGLIVATGCYAQTDSAALVAMTDVDLVVPNLAKDQLVRLLGDKLQEKAEGNLQAKLPEGVEEVDRNRQGHFKSVLHLQPANPSRTRSFLKIQDGCNGFCAYCLIPYARGQSRSANAADIRAEVRRQIDIGSQEIVFTGIHIGDFGRHQGAPHAEPLADLVAELFDWPDMIRLRLSSMEPMELSEPLLKAAQKRPELFCDHFHMPLQSGQDRILKLMGRSYDTAAYLDKLALARSYFPDAYYSCDVIPGFPGETADDALATESFIEQAELTELHVFPYSPRPNTRALRMPDKVDPEQIKARALRLRVLSHRLKNSYLKGQIGRTSRVLWESSGRGLSQNYLHVVPPKTYTPRPGTVESVVIKGFVDQEFLLAQPQLLTNGLNDSGQGASADQI